MGELVSAQAEIVHLREQLSLANSEAETRIQSMKKQQLEAKTRAKALIQKQREQAQERVTQIERDMEKQQAELVRLKDVAEERAMFKDRAAELEALVVSGRGDLQKVLEQKEVVERKLRSMEEELVRVKESDNTERVSLQRKVAELGEQLKVQREGSGLPNGSLNDQEDNKVNIELEQTRQKLSAFESECEELRGENERLVRSASAEKGDVNRNREPDNISVEHALEELRGEVRRAKERADRLEADLIAVSEEYSAKQKKLEETLDELRAEKKEAEEKLSKSKEHVVHLEGDLKKSELALREEREKLINSEWIISETTREGNESTKILEAKVVEMERVIAAKQADLVKVREKARAYLKDINAEKREMEEKLKIQIEDLRQELQDEQDKAKDAEKRAENTTAELDNCLVLIREKQKNIQMLKMAVSTEKKAAEEARRGADSLRTEFSAYKERARLALQVRGNSAGSSQNAVEEATSALRLELDKTKKELGSLRHQVESLKSANARVDELAERAEKAEAALDLLRNHTTGIANANYSQIDALEEKLANAESELRTAQVALGDSEDRHETTKMRLEATERALRSTEVRAEEVERVSDRSIESLKKQVEKLKQEVDREKKSAAAAQRTAAAAAKALSFSNGEDLEGRNNLEKRIDRSPPANERTNEEFSPYSSSASLTRGRSAFLTAMEDHSDSLGLSSRNNLYNDQVEDTETEITARNQQIAVLTAQVAELGAMLDDAQQETNLKSEQTALLKNEVKNLDAKLAAAEKLQNGAPFSYLRTIVVRYLETEDPTLLPVISNVLSFTDEEIARIRVGRKSQSSIQSLPSGPQKSGYFSLSFLGSR